MMLVDSAFRRCGLYRRHIEQDLTDVVTLQSGYSQAYVRQITFLWLVVLVAETDASIRLGPLKPPLS